MLRGPNGKGKDGGGRRRSLTLEKKEANEKLEGGVEGEKMDVDEDVKYPAPQEALPAIREAAKAQLAAVSKVQKPVPAKQPAVEAKKWEDAMDVDELAGAMSALRFVPTSVRLGKGKARPKKDQ